MNEKQALYYISLYCDMENENTEEENLKWKKANQNRLNQNFEMLKKAIESLEKRLES